MGTANNSYSVIVSARAQAMLINHARFLGQVSEEAAMQFIISFEKRAKSLEIFPERNPYLVDPLITEGKYRKAIFEKRYLLIYTVEDIRVYIDAVVDCRGEYSWLLTM